MFDQPDLKAKFKLFVSLKNLPARNVVTNTQKLGEFVGRNGIHSVEFAETLPISTYVFSFAAGNFLEYFEPGSEGDKISRTFYDDGSSTVYEPRKSDRRVYVRQSQEQKFKPHAAEVFRLNREGIKYLESYFDYKFPFPKYDIVLIPEFPFGGMEHAGATFFREASVIFPTEPTKNDYISRANLIFHEAAHQWFGDTVTMKWFDDLWLKEGFAEFMAYKTLEKVMPEYNAWKVFYERNKQAAYLTDSTKGTTPIYQEIANLNSAKSAYGNIVYRKAPSFLKQAEFYLGPEKFQTAVRTFLKKHAYANAGWEDLVKEFETAGWQVYLKDFAKKWVTQPGVPVIKIGYQLRCTHHALGRRLYRQGRAPRRPARQAPAGHQPQEHRLLHQALHGPRGTTKSHAAKRRWCPTRSSAARTSSSRSTSSAARSTRRQQISRLDPSGPQEDRRRLPRREGRPRGHHRARLLQRRPAPGHQGRRRDRRPQGRAHHQRAHRRGPRLRPGQEEEREDRRLRPRRRHVRHLHPRHRRRRLRGALPPTATPTSAATTSTSCSSTSSPRSSARRKASTSARTRWPCSASRKPRKRPRSSSPPCMETTDQPAVHHGRRRAAPSTCS